MIAAGLVALGTVVSEHTFAAAGLLFVVALCVSLSTAMGRNVATGANGVLLFFLVACAVPAPVGALESRVPGVLLGGGISLVAALTIWPQRPQDRLRSALADATEALATRIGQLGQPPHDDADSLGQPFRDALASARPERLAVGERPTLASERDHAQLRVGYGLSRAQLLFERLLQRPAPLRAVADAERTLAKELRQALDATAAALRGEGPPPAVTCRSTPGARTGSAPTRRSSASSPPWSQRHARGRRRPRGARQRGLDLGQRHRHRRPRRGRRRPLPGPRRLDERGARPSRGGHAGPPRHDRVLDAQPPLGRVPEQPAAGGRAGARAAARRHARGRERLLGPVRDPERRAHERPAHGRQRVQAVLGT